MRVLRPILLGSAIIGIVLVVLFAGLVLRHGTIKATAFTPSRSDQLQAKLQQARSDRATGKPAVLSLDESELNALISSKMPAKSHATDSGKNDQQAQVRDFRVKLLNERADVYLSWNFRGQEMSLDIEGKLQTVNGYIQFDPSSGSLGALPLPRSLLEAALKQATDSPDIHEKLRLPPNLTDLRIADSHVIATYK